MSRQRFITDTQWLDCLAYFGHCCAICGRPAQAGLIIVGDHWIPRAYHGKDNPQSVVTNIVPICHSTAHGMNGCNQLKRETLPHTWLKSQYDDTQVKAIEKRVRDYFRSICPDYTDHAKWEITRLFYKLREVSEITGIPLKALQQWDKTGVLVADRLPGGRRIYTKEHIRMARGLEVHQ